MPTDSRRVLVIEDDRSLRELLSLVLTDEGYETRAAAGGREALDLVHEWRPDLIVLDLIMHDMDGWAFRTAQRSNGLADIPVLVLTAANSPEAQARALAAPVLPKPFELDQFLGTVRVLTDCRRHVSGGSRSLAASH